jgi:hypothetical protein
LTRGDDDGRDRINRIQEGDVAGIEVKSAVDSPSLPERSNRCDGKTIRGDELPLVRDLRR